MAQRPDNFTINPSHPLAQGLVFAGLGAMPGSTRYHDSSVYGNTGTLTNMEPPTDWVWDGTLNRMCIDFANTTQWVNCGAALPTSTEWTVSVWGKPQTNARYIVGDGGGSPTNLIIQYVAAASTLNVYVDGIENATLGTFPLNEWTHVAVALSGTTATIYRNGVYAGVINGLSWTGLTGAMFLSNRGDGGRPWVGTACDPITHRRALTLPEIQQLADPSNVMLSGLIQPPRRKWWPVVSGAAPTFKAAWATKRRQTIGGGVI